MPSKRARKWSGLVTQKSDALDIEGGIFASIDPHEIAVSLKKSAEKSQWSKSNPFRSAISMLTFYLRRKARTLEAAKCALCQEFERDKK